MRALQQRWPMPKKPRPIVFLGAGGIVRSAHLPAYRAAGFEVRGAFDLSRAAAEATARQFGLPRVYDTLDEALAERGVVFDLAVPADAVLPVLKKVPRRATILIQKPLGRDLAEAKKILAVCRAKKLVAAVNFQLRFAPNALAVRDALARQLLGRIREVEVRVVTYTPWSNWTFMRGIPRLEILYHSIHYLDFVRSLFGEPDGVVARASADPFFARYADTRTSIELTYPRRAHGLRVTVHTNHAHDFGSEKKASEILFEGDRGAARLKMGVNLDYPKGEPDALEFRARGVRGTWKSVSLRGSWFVDAFEGTMANLQRFAAGEDRTLHTAVADAARTMALVEACYRSTARTPTRIPKV
jgi:predicted dehydrogenase